MSTSAGTGGEVRNIKKPSPITVDPIVLKKKLGKMRDLSNGHSMENGYNDLDSPRTPRTVATPGKMRIRLVIFHDFLFSDFRIQ